jgi:hypothetical protein
MRTLLFLLLITAAVAEHCNDMRNATACYRLTDRCMWCPNERWCTVYPTGSCDEWRHTPAPTWHYFALAAVLLVAAVAGLFLYVCVRTLGADSLLLLVLPVALVFVVFFARPELLIIAMALCIVHMLYTYSTRAAPIE